MVQFRKGLLPVNNISAGDLHAQSLPLYAQLKSQLNDRILSGEFPIEGKFLTEQEICEEYELSRVTVRKALKLMEQEGTLLRMRSRGSYVKQLPPSFFVEQTAGVPHIPRKVEIRCMLPSPIPKLWNSSWFQERFKQRFPEVTLNFTEGRQDQPIHRRYNGLDLYTVPPQEYAALLARNLLEPWTEVLGETKWKELLADIPSDLVRYVGYDKIGHLLPLVYSPIAFIYNPRRFEQAGLSAPRFNWSEEEFFSVCEVLHNSQGTQQRFFPFFCDFSSQFRWPFAIYREGGRVWSKDGLTCTLDHKESLKGIHFYKKMIIEKGWGRPHHGNLPGSDYTLFSGGHVAIQLGSMYTVAMLIEQGCKDWEILSVPEGVQRACVSTNALLAVSPHIRDRELIAEFIEFTRDPELQREQFRHWKMLNTSQKALNTILQDVSQEERGLIHSFTRLNPEIHEIEYPVSFLAQAKLNELIQLLWIDLEHAEDRCREIAAEINRMPELVELRK